MEKTRVYKRAKALFEEQSCGELEKVMNNPKKWWKFVQKMKAVNKRGEKVDVTKVYDKAVPGRDCLVIHFGVLCVIHNS